MTAQPMMRFEFRNADDDPKRGELLIYDVIGEDLWGGVSARQFARDLKDLGDIEALDVRINSIGGFVDDGAAIYNQLAKHDAKVTTHIDGFALSSASVIAMAGDEISIAANGVMMIHNPWSLAIGESKDLRKAAEALDTMREGIANVYAARTGRDRQEIIEQMDAETWFDADEAIAAGFADVVAPAKAKPANMAPPFNVPERFRSRFTAANAPTTHVVAVNHASDAGATEGEGDMSDKKTEPITAEAFAAEQPDAVNSWKNEGGEAERQRHAALCAAFPDRPAFAAEQFAKGHTVEQAKAELADVLLEESKAKDKQIDELSKRVDHGADAGAGADAVALDAAADDEGDEPDPATAWRDNYQNCNERFKSQYAYACYRVSAEKARRRKRPAT